MYVARVSLSNFRAFKGVHTIVLHPQLTVFGGVNGSGKSSVLDAIGIGMSWAASYLGGSRASWFGGGDTANIHVGADSAGWDVFFVDGEAETGVGLEAHMEVPKAPTAATPNFPLLDRLRAGVADGTATLPLLACVHTSSGRLPLRHPEHDAKLSGRLLAYRGAFDAEALQFQDLEAWFEQEENLENQEKIRLRNLGYSLPSLRAVRGAVQRGLGALHGNTLGPPGVLRQHSADPLKPAKGRLTIPKGPHALFIDQLSDGERRLVFLILDTARRMVVLNPTLADPTEAPGVLVVDEVELHLHPQWQRTVVAALRAAFPNVQLILSTHAPTVLSSVPNESVRMLAPGGVLVDTAHTYGRDPNTILLTGMDTQLRPDDVQKEIDALFRAADEKPRAARRLLKVLEAKLGADDPELVRARALIDLLAG